MAVRERQKGRPPRRWPPLLFVHGLSYVAIKDALPLTDAYPCGHGDGQPLPANDDGPLLRRGHAQQLGSALCLPLDRLGCLTNAQAGKRRDGNAERERRSLADGAIHPDAAPMRFDNPLDDRQPEASARTPLAVGLPESVEHVLQLLRGNAATSVRHAEFDNILRNILRR